MIIGHSGAYVLLCTVPVTVLQSVSEWSVGRPAREVCQEGPQA